MDASISTISIQKMRKSEFFGFTASTINHQEREDVEFTMRVTGGYNEPLDRQLMERVHISNFRGPLLMNRRNEMGGLRVERTQYRRWGGD